jgi:hypothetical protein
MKVKLVAFLAVILAVYSCSDLDKGRQVQSIDQMNKSLDSLETILYQNKIDTIAGIRNAANTLMIRFRRSYMGDTINMKIGRKMAILKKVRQAIDPEFEAEEEGENENERSTIGRSYAFLNKGIKEERSALKKLRDDIENGNGERNKYNEYITFENEKVNQLRLLMKNYVEYKDKTLKSFYEVYNDLDSFTKELEKKKALQTH